MDITIFLINFILYIPPIIVTLYVGSYITLHFTFFRVLEKKREAIRLKVAGDWDKKYGGFIGIIDNVDVKHIRVLLRPRIDETKGFRQWQAAYIGYLILIVIVALIFRSYNNPPIILRLHNAYLFWRIRSGINKPLYCKLLRVEVL